MMQNTGMLMGENGRIETDPRVTVYRYDTGEPLEIRLRDMESYLNMEHVAGQWLGERVFLSEPPAVTLEQRAAANVAGGIAEHNLGIDMQDLARDVSEGVIAGLTPALNAQTELLRALVESLKK
jgi:hypothetical protein